MEKGFWILTALVVLSSLPSTLALEFHLGGRSSSSPHGHQDFTVVTHTNLVLGLDKCAAQPVSKDEESNTPSNSFGPGTVQTPHSKGSSSSLTVNDLQVLLAGGRRYDFQTRTWSNFGAATGPRRENLLLSWEALRKKTPGSPILPAWMRYSK